MGTRERGASGGEPHGHGLAEDLQAIGREMFARRRALAFMASAGTAAALAACGGDDSSSSSSSGATSSSSTSSSSTSSSSSSTSSTSSSSTSGGTSDASCIADPTETNGPYPADGTNTASGSTSNVLTQSGVVRSDIRSSFIGSTNTADGVQLTIELQLVDVSNGCTPIEGAAIYVWHCDAAGLYSLYSSGVTTESYLRGVQVTDSDGKVTFTTIYPACYSGRWPHIHFEVFTGGLTSASTGRTATLISQLAMPAANNTAVFTGDTRYTASIANYNAISLSSDNVFGDNTSAQIAQQTPSLSGSVSAGYTGTALIGIAT
ncbi:Protocatechuate 3,4-dioxygenase beta subunit precursor [Novosphingobium resinovorum]|uniref:Protocatechuate 3,4-dioxygenase beta subunit n=1 Tax=Novosphingobium resinovorum TaxID=158500 RepID=A0A031JTE1_9SPHN|nr:MULTISPECIES: intradiol ring-cleavage dioxygenase [Novosphingobium]EZP80205.1 Protocatechuate 3,4-dioxygenase beta subunit precursor [Novosphingobium resinovorum]MBF7012834.1 intradiol ring-cleavage dioxygenase [Novosphingobium sp. HR1a]